MNSFQFTPQEFNLASMGSLESPPSLISETKTAPSSPLQELENKSTQNLSQDQVVEQTAKDLNSVASELITKALEKQGFDISQSQQQAQQLLDQLQKLNPTLDFAQNLATPANLIQKNTLVNLGLVGVLLKGCSSVMIFMELNKQLEGWRQLLNTAQNDPSKQAEIQKHIELLEKTIREKQEKFLEDSLKDIASSMKDILKEIAKFSPQASAALNMAASSLGLVGLGVGAFQFKKDLEKSLKNINQLTEKIEELKLKKETLQTPPGSTYKEPTEICETIVDLKLYYTRKVKLTEEVVKLISVFMKGFYTVLGGAGSIAAMAGATGLAKAISGPTFPLLIGVALMTAATYLMSHARELKSYLDIWQVERKITNMEKNIEIHRSTEFKAIEMCRKLLSGQGEAIKVQIEEKILASTTKKTRIQEELDHVEKKYRQLNDRISQEQSKKISYKIRNNYLQWQRKKTLVKMENLIGKINKHQISLQKLKEVKSDPLARLSKVIKKNEAHIQKTQERINVHKKEREALQKTQKEHLQADLLGISDQELQEYKFQLQGLLAYPSVTQKIAEELFDNSPDFLSKTVEAQANQIVEYIIA